MSKITVQTNINKEIAKVWEYYTEPQHIIHWNFASEDWCCPSAENDLRVGGTYKARMEAKDGSFGFDFEAKYDEINMGQGFSYSMDGRSVAVEFLRLQDKTSVSVTFDAEEENSLEMQQNGWQAILDNFKKYAETID